MTYGSVNAGENEVKLSEVETVGVGVHAVVVVDELLLSRLVHRDSNGDAGLPVRNIKGGVHSILFLFQIGFS